MVRTPDVRKGRRERGSAAVEFALVLPLLLIMALAIVQIGLLVKDRIVVEEAARAGAREAAVTSDDGKVRETAVAAAVGLDESRIEVTIARSGGSGSAVTVTVHYDAPVDIPLVTWLFPGSVAMDG